MTGIAPEDGTIGVCATPTLDIAYVEAGPAGGAPVVLLHGFPYDVCAYAEVWPALAAAGCRVIAPWLRGFGPTRFRDPATPRSGEQAALASDLSDLIVALALDRPVVAGYDWGGRAACLTAALWPETVSGLVSCGGYNAMPPPQPDALLSPFMEHALWYQRLLHHSGAEAWLAANRADFCRYIWRIWSPDWAFADADFARSAPAFDNPDFVAVAVHSYRHRWGRADGDPALADVARRAEALPTIATPTIVLQGDGGPSAAAANARDRSRFTGAWDFRQLTGVGHNVPQEAPRAMADAVLRLVADR